MATRAWSLFLVVMLCCEAVYVDGRHLKAKEEEEVRKNCSRNSPDEGVSGNDLYPSGDGNESNEAEHTYEYRPTDPGHSPGVGHSDKN